MCHMHTVRNPAYGMSVIQAPNDAVNVQSNDEHTYEGKMHYYLSA